MTILARVFHIGTILIFPLSVLGNDFSVFSSPSMEILSRSDHDGPLNAVYPFWAKVLEIESIKYHPEARFQGVLSNCLDWNRLSVSFQKRSAAAQILLDCEQEFKIIDHSFLMSPYKTMMLGLDVNHYPSSKFVVFHLRDGTKVKGFLALKKSKTPLPLMILRLGIFSNSTEFYPERFLFNQFFEQMNFHVLVLESSTSQEFLSRNHQVFFAGVEEGIQNFLIAQILKSEQEKISQIISNIYLSGISMGGQGLFLTAKLNELNLINGNKLISKMMAFCPLVDLKSTFDQHFSKKIVNMAINRWSKFRLNGLEKDFSEFKGDYPLQALFKKVESADWKKRIELSQLKVPKDLSLKSADFWKLHDFTDLALDIKDPFLIVSTKQDPIVPFSLNSGKLIGQNQNLQVLTLNEGVHCGLPGEYEWISLSAIWDFFLTPKDKQQVYEEKEFVLDQKMKSLFANPKSATNWSIIWSWQEEGELLKLNLEIPRWSFFPRWWPYQQSWVIEFKDLGLEKDRSSAALLQRVSFLLRPRLADGKLVLKYPVSQP